MFEVCPDCGEMGLAVPDLGHVHIPPNTVGVLLIANAAGEVVDAVAVAVETVPISLN